MLSKNTADLAAWMSLWSELNCTDPFALKFLPFGFSSEQEPSFFRLCLNRAVASMSIEDFQYAEYSGIPSVRAAFLKFFDSRFHDNSKLTAQDNIVATFGANQIIRIAMQTFLRSHDDEIILAEPLYPNYLLGLKYIGKLKTFPINLNKQTLKFEYDFEKLEAVLSDKTRLLVLINPNNPTGKVPTEAEYRRLTEILDKFPKVVVVEDAAYCNFMGDQHPIRFFREFGDNFKKTITVFSAGKKLNVTGVRVGWGISDKPIIDLMKLTMSQDLTTSTIDQNTVALALEEATKPYGGAPDYWAFSAQLNLEKYNFVSTALREVGISVSPLEGSYYIALHIESLMHNIEDEYLYSLKEPNLREPWKDRAVCRKLIKEYKIGLIPYSALYISENPIDTVLRVPLIRTKEELRLLVEALKEVSKQAED